MAHALAGLALGTAGVAVWALVYWLIYLAGWGSDE